MKQQMCRSGENGSPPLLPPSVALYLDFDGTLADLAARPDAVRVEPSLVALLEDLRRHLDGALAIVSGRPLREIDAFLQPVMLPGAGLHGAELRFADGCQVGVPEVAQGAAAAVQALRARFGTDPRLLIEDKGPAVALHFRGAPERAEECLQAARELAGTGPLELVTGKKVVELRPSGIDKGLAVCMLSASPPFRGRLPVYVGDDLTDEDGFAAAAALSGFGVKVGEGGTLAQYRCRDVAQVHVWLRGSIQQFARKVPKATLNG